MSIIPNYIEMGFASTMGPILKAYAERELSEDLLNYNISSQEFRFDWSESCIEGRTTPFLDGVFENYSEVAVFNQHDEIIVDGWIDFVEVEKDLEFIIYWDKLTFYAEGSPILIKPDFGIPDHVWNRMSENLKALFAESRMKKRPRFP